MLKIERLDWRKCAVFVSDVKTKNVRTAIAVHAMNQGLPRSISNHIARKALSRKERGIRLYCLTDSLYFFANYDTGLILIGTEYELADVLLKQYCVTQFCLWLRMADRAAQGKKMHYREIQDYILEGPEDDPEIMTKNVAPSDRLAPKCRRKRRKRGRVKPPRAAVPNETQQESFRKGPLRIVGDLNTDGITGPTPSKGVA